MSMPNSLRSYTDCEELFDRAKSDPKGARACLGTLESATNMRTRMHYFRKLARLANEEIYPRGDPLHGVSVYDELVVQIIKDENAEYWLYIQPRSAKILEVQGLSELEDEESIHG